MLQSVTSPSENGRTSPEEEEEVQEDTEDDKIEYQEESSERPHLAYLISQSQTIQYISNFLEQFNSFD